MDDEYAGGVTRRIQDCSAANNHCICAAGNRDFDRYRHVLAEEFRRIWHAELDLHCPRLRIDAGIDVDERSGKLSVWKSVGRRDGNLSKGEESQVLLIDLYDELHRTTG